MGQLEVRSALMQTREKMTPARRASSFRRVYRWQFPLRFEQLLNRLLVDVLLPVQQSLADMIGGHPDVVALKRKDGFDDDLKQFLEAQDVVLLAYVGGTLTSVSLAPLVEQTLEFVFKYNARELERYFKDVLGKTLPYSMEWKQAIKAQLRQEIETRAVGAIRDIRQKIQDYVLKAVRANTPLEDVISEILRINETLTKAKAEFVARDIAGTFNAQVVKQISTEILGTDFYVWTTRADELVRGRPDGKYPKAVPSHWVMEQVLCRWSDSSTYSLDRGKTWISRTDKMPKKLPGEDWACRCSGTPWVGVVMAEVDRQLEALNGRE